MTSTKTERLVSSMELFRGLSSHIRATLLTRADIKHFASGDSLLKRGMAFPGLFVVASGQLKTSRTNSSGKEQVFEICEPGHCVGYGPISAGNMFSTFDVIGRREGEVLILPYGDVREAMENDTQFALRIFDRRNARADRMQGMVDAFSLKDANTRLAEWLVIWLEQAYPNKELPYQAVLPFTQSEIAAQVGTVREVISRGLTRLEREGAISVSGRRMRVLSLDILRAAAEA